MTTNPTPSFLGVVSAERNCGVCACIEGGDLGVWQDGWSRASFCCRFLMQAVACAGLAGGGGCGEVAAVPAADTAQHQPVRALAPAPSLGFTGSPGDSLGLVAAVFCMARPLWFFRKPDRMSPFGRMSFILPTADQARFRRGDHFVAILQPRPP